MIKNAFDLLCDQAARIDKILLSLVKTVSAHGVWIRILSTILLAILVSLVAIMMKGI